MLREVTRLPLEDVKVAPHGVEVLTIVSSIGLFISNAACGQPIGGTDLLEDRWGGAGTPRHINDIFLFLLQCLLFIHKDVKIITYATTTRKTHNVLFYTDL